MSLRSRQFAVALLAAVALGAGPAQAADPFYTRLLGDGADARARGDLETAIEDLRIACFGLLDEPPLLAEGLVELALAQAGAGQSADFDRTIDRLLQVEDQFQGYSQADLATAAREQFEDLLYRRIDPTRLDGIAAFAPLAERRAMDALMAAGPDQRRLMLQDRLANEPTNSQWLRLLADLETTQGQPAAAVPHLSALLDRTPGDPFLRCERFRAAARAGLCEIALADLPSCPADAADAQLAQPILQCYIARGGWQEAAAYLDTLPAGLRSTSKVRKLDRQVQKELRNLPVVAESEPLPVDIEGDFDPTSDAGDPEVATAESEPEAAPILDPCDPFRSAARSGRCEAALAELSTCLGAAAERQVAPSIMKCHTNASDWPAALAFAEILPAEVRGLSKIRKLERRAAKQLAKQAPPSDAIEGGETATSVEGEDSDSGAVVPGQTDTAGTPSIDTTDAAGSAETAPPIPSQLPESSSAPSEAALANARRILASASTSADITRAYAVTGRLAIDHPNHRESQLLAAQGAYRAAQWDKSVAFFNAAGGPSNDQPLLQFYNAIALFETGHPRQAADLLEIALPKIRRTPFVDSYVARINAAAGRQ